MRTRARRNPGRASRIRARRGAIPWLAGAPPYLSRERTRARRAFSGGRLPARRAGGWRGAACPCSVDSRSAPLVEPWRGIFVSAGGVLRPGGGTFRAAESVPRRQVGHRRLGAHLRPPEHRENLSSPEAQIGTAIVAGDLRAPVPLPVLLLVQQDPVPPACPLPALPPGIPLAASLLPGRIASRVARPRRVVRPPGRPRTHGMPGFPVRPPSVLGDGGWPFRPGERLLLPLCNGRKPLVPGFPLRRHPVYD